MQEEAVQEQGENDTPPPQLPDPQRVAPFDNRHKGNIRGNRGKAIPRIAASLLSLPIDRMRPAQRQNQERTEKHQRGEIAIEQQMRKRPENDAP